MRPLTMILLIALCSSAYSQEKPSKFRVVMGFSLYEFLHAGINYNVTDRSQVGLGVGIFPAPDFLYPTIICEHRYYFNSLPRERNRKAIFFRQTLSYSMDTNTWFAVCGAGADLRSRHQDRGWTVDAGPGYYYSERVDKTHKGLYIALRIQYSMGIFNKSR